MAKKNHTRFKRNQNDGWKLTYLKLAVLSYEQVDTILRGEGFGIEDGVEWVPGRGYRQSSSFTAKYGKHKSYLKTSVIEFMDNFPAPP